LGGVRKRGKEPPKEEVKEGGRMSQNLHPPKKGEGEEEVKEMGGHNPFLLLFQGREAFA